MYGLQMACSSPNQVSGLLSVWLKKRLEFCLHRRGWRASSPSLARPDYFLLVDDLLSIDRDVFENSRKRLPANFFGG